MKNPYLKCFEHLLLQFLHHDFSVSNFSTGLNFAAMEHYRSQPLSFLCCEREIGISRAKIVSKKDIEKINVRKM